jgi:hypothetical protein
MPRPTAALFQAQTQQDFPGRVSARRPRPECAPADPILISAASARAVTDDQFLPLKDLSN